MDNNDITFVEKENIIKYSLISFVLLYVWYVSEIPITTLTPILLIGATIYYYQYKQYVRNEKQDIEFDEIKQHIFKNHKFITDKEIIMFLNKIHHYSDINEELYVLMLDYIDYFLENHDVDLAIRAIDILDDFSYSVDMEQLYQHERDIRELKRLLYSHLDKEKYKKVEFQSYIPFDSTQPKNYVHV
jgi:hypothetical protein